MVKYLYNSSEIRTQIKKIFLSTEKEKWAIVGFVGYGGLDQLPKGVTGLQVICWPKAGATHPDGVRRLLEADISVYFCENLHHKLYWAKDVGLIAGSANLSARALGGTAQHEFCVYCEDPKFDIKSVLRGLKYKPVDEKSLHALDIAHVAAGSSDMDLTKNTKSLPSFQDASKGKHPKKWKIVCWDTELEDDEPIRKAVSQETGQPDYTNFNEIDPGMFEIGDFVLQVGVDENGEIMRSDRGKWLRIELLMKHGGKNYGVQIKKMADGVAPPFRIDSEFQKKFKATFNNSTWPKILDKRAFVSSEFIKLLLTKS